MKLLSFGEVLWDVYPDEKYIGGAPLNFAAHANKNGLEAYMVSAIGNDDLREDTLNCLKQWHVNSDYVAVLEDYVTGKCLVSLNEQGIPSYNLLSDVAYDYIPVPILQEDFDVLYFGTLSLRSNYNLNSLKTLMSQNSFKEIFVDVNIRAPHYSKESIQLAFCFATMIKISDEELPVVLDALNLGDAGSLALTAKKIQEAYSNLKLVLITCGEKGSLVYVKDEGIYTCEAKKTQVVSTVGAGDSFSATFLAKYLQASTIQDCLETASKVSAYVVSQAGAIPEYDLENL